MQREVNIMIAEYNEYLCGEIKLMCMFMIPTIICASIFIYFIVDTIKRNPFAKKRLRCKKKKVLSRKEYLDNLIGLSIVLTICGFVLTYCTVYGTFLILDVNEGDYITYKGEFTIESLSYASKGGYTAYVKISNSEKAKRYRFNPNLEYWEEDTTYDGYVVYSKRSKIIVDWGGNLKTTDLPS